MGILFINGACGMAPNKGLQMVRRGVKNRWAGLSPDRNTTLFAKFLHQVA
jgi:hypothetical protein